MQSDNAIVMPEEAEIVNDIVSSSLGGSVAKFKGEGTSSLGDFAARGRGDTGVGCGERGSALD